MLIYSHSTPEVLTALFKTKEQIKSSQYCSLIDENFPDDVMTLTGDDLIIKESENTLNLDMALAVAYNSIRSCSSAIQFGKIFVINGANIDTYTLKYYLEGIQSGPFSDCVKNNIQAHFDLIFNEQLAPKTGDIINFPSDGTLGPVDTTKGTYGRVSRPNFRNNIDLAFKKTLIKQLLNCLTAPCNYFNYTGSSYGYLGRSEQTINTVTAPDIDKTGAGIPNITALKIPIGFLKTIVAAVDSSIRAAKKLSSRFGSAPGIEGSTLKPDTSTHEAYSRASSEIEALLATQLGDCYRIYDFDKRYNPYDYTQNKQTGRPATAPGGGSTSVRTTESLDSTPKPENKKVNTTSVSGEASSGSIGIAGVFGPIPPNQVKNSKFYDEEFITDPSRVNNADLAAPQFIFNDGDIVLNSEQSQSLRENGANPFDLISVQIQGESNLRRGRWVSTKGNLLVTFYTSDSNLAITDIEGGTSIGEVTDILVNDQTVTKPQLTLEEAYKPYNELSQRLYNKPYNSLTRQQKDTIVKKLRDSSSELKEPLLPLGGVDFPGGSLLPLFPN